ncbi:hypothetical protein [Oscillibacter sp.]|uniref:hypothetical protein n=1 Tax=Oscillibacter sp. TaxID=1945593 RepID=UPI0028A14BD9|nr:hypothetical protein [Oscillibacter sp.]
MNTFNIEKEFMLFRDGTVAMLNTSWDTEKKMRAQDKGNMEYAVGTLGSMDVFTPVNTWRVQWPNKLPEWLVLSVTEKKIKTMARRWARRHIFQNRRFPVRAGKSREEYYVNNCRSVHLIGYKASVMAAGDTRVTVQNAETSVYILDKKVKLNKEMLTIPETTNVYTLFDSPTVAADSASQPAAASTSPKTTSTPQREPRIDEQLRKIPWMCEHFEHDNFAYLFGTHKHIQGFLDGFQAGSKDLSFSAEGSEQFKIGVIFGQSPHREELLTMLKRCPVQLHTNFELVSVCDQIIRMEERSSLSDRERIVLNDLKESFDRFERGTEFGCLPLYAEEKFSPNVIHCNESLTVQGGRETYCLSVYCNNRWYILNHLSEEKCETETEKLLSFARENGYLIEKHEGGQWNTPVVKQEEEQEIKYLQELGIKYTTEYYDNGYYNGYRYSFHNDHSDAASEYDGCLHAGEQSNRGMRPELRKIGLTDSQIDVIRDKNNGPIAGLITDGDLHYETTDIRSLITHADGSFRKSQAVISLLQPDLQNCEELGL